MRTRSKPLSAGFVRTVKAPGRYGDGGRGSHGLYLRVWERANGRTGKAWAQRLRINGRATNLGLGPYPVVSLAEAREKAVANRRAAYQGRDPRGDGIPTFRTAAEKVIRLHSKSWKPGSDLPSKWRQTLRDYAFPRLGSKPVSSITTSDVMAVLSPIWSTKPGAARIVRQRIGAVLKWAVAKGYREDNAAGDAITAALPRNSGHKHHKAVPHSEVGEVIQRVRESRFQPSARLALELLVLTGCRASEVRGARWSEIDLEARLWTIPAERMKAGRQHRVPLSVQALAVLDQARRRGDGDLVFPSRTTGRQMSNNALGDITRGLGVAGTVHGMRTAFRSWAAEQGADRAVAEAALAHIVKGVEGAYQRSDLLEQRRSLMQTWADYNLFQPGDEPERGKG